MSAQFSREESDTPLEREVPEVLHTLFQEHRHLNALVRVVLEKINQTERLQLVDYYLLRDIIGYLHDYPNEVHHPTENLVFDKLLIRRPSLKKAVQRLRNDHEIVLVKTQELLDLADQAIENPSSENEILIRKACRDFGWHQQEHMKFEDLELFPEAFEWMTAADWSTIETQVAAVNDPLFGGAVGNQHRLLYEYLMDSALGAGENFNLGRAFSFRRFMMAGKIVERGVGSCCSRLLSMGGALAQETVSTMKQSVKPDSIGSALVLPMKYASFMSSSMLHCSRDLVGIWTRSARETLELYSSADNVK